MEKQKMDVTTEREATQPTPEPISTAMQALDRVSEGINRAESCLTPTEARRLAHHLGKAADLLAVCDGASESTLSPTPTPLDITRRQYTTIVGTLQTPKESIEPRAEVVLPRQTLESEPVHIQLADAYIEKLGIAQEYRGAFEGLIDPNNKGELSDNKRDVVAIIREIIEKNTDSEDVICQLKTGGNGGVVAVRRLLGMYHKNNRKVLKDPVQLHDQIRNFPKRQQVTYIEDFYASFQELLATLPSAEA